MDIYMSQTGTVGKGNARKVGEERCHANCVRMN